METETKEGEGGKKRGRDKGMHRRGERKGKKKKGWRRNEAKATGADKEEGEREEAR